MEKAFTCQLLLHVWWQNELLAAVQGGWALKITWDRRAKGEVCGTPVGLR